MSDWLAQLTAANGAGPVVRIVVASVRGSAPREAGACMLVSEATSSGTIGGGRLELTAIESARTLLAGRRSWQTLQVPLGPQLGQCCGGVVDLWCERLDAADRTQLAGICGSSAHTEDLLVATLGEADGSRRRLLIAEDGGASGFANSAIGQWVQREAAALMQTGSRARLSLEGPRALLVERLGAPATPLALFGAGHVGKALAARLAGLPFAVTWVDSRPGMFLDVLPANVHAILRDDPVDEARGAPPGCAFVIMTHSHALDYELCRTLLARDDARFVGLIGSHTKAARFAHRLAREGMATERISRLVCPIGIAGIDSKRPEAIAIGVAAQLLRLHEASWDRTGAHERGRRANAVAEAHPQVVPIVIHRT
jgi:xanthine dehydrogenase accessory factor